MRLLWASVPEGASPPLVERAPVRKILLFVTTVAITDVVANSGDHLHKPSDMVNHIVHVGAACHDLVTLGE